MLTELRVKNLALITAAELEFGSGLTVLSGETGAGKTALLSSLKLLIGERGDSSLVGNNDSEARVEALFCDVSDAEETESLPTAVDEPEQEHLVVRRITADGRSRCYFDDAMVTVGKLGKTLGPSVDLYGQHEHQSLLKAAEQLKILDEYAGPELRTVLSAYQKGLQDHHEAAAELEHLQELSNSSSAEREQATFVLREIAKVAPRPGEYEALEAELPRLQNGEQLAESATYALALLRDEGGVLEGLDKALRALEVIQSLDTSFNEPTQQLEALSIDLEEVAQDIGRYASGIEYDPEKLQVALDRLGELDGLSRRFGPGMNQVFALLERSEQLLQTTGDADGLITKAEAALAGATETLEIAARELAEVRAAAAERFLAELNNSIASLALAGASMEFAIQDMPFERWNSTGSQSFELLYSPALDASPRPLAKIVSGGELSRVMLAVKSLLQTGGTAMTLVFDEIDAGIGGATAHAVAERLASLAQRHQVIVITHLAQIAAQANHHFLVSRTSSGGTTHTNIERLCGDGRVQEVARMLSGTTDKEAITHAKKLLKEADND